MRPEGKPVLAQSRVVEIDGPLRRRTLSPVQVRVALLAARGLSMEETAATLGITPGTLRTHRSAIRRRLAVPPGGSLDRFLRENPPIGGPAEDDERVPRRPAPPAVERRSRWLLRLALEEVRSLARRADAHARALGEAARADALDTDARVEADGLARVSEALTELHRDLVDGFRVDRRAGSMPA